MGTIVATAYFALDGATGAAGGTEEHGFERYTGVRRVFDPRELLEDDIARLEDDPGEEAGEGREGPRDPSATGRVGATLEAR
jgi:hypothetical protein